MRAAAAHPTYLVVNAWRSIEAQLRNKLFGRHTTLRAYVSFSQCVYFFFFYFNDHLGLPFFPSVDGHAEKNTSGDIGNGTRRSAGRESFTLHGASAT